MGRRVPASRTLTPSADQVAFAVIVYEWMFGRRVSPGAAVTPAPPSGVERGALSQALTRALSLDRDRQFDSIDDFVTALEQSQTPALPLTAEDEEADEALVPFVPEESSDVPAAASTAREQPAADLDIRPVVAAEPPPLKPEVSQPARSEPARFGGFALIFAAIVGAVFGFAAGYMARPRALQSGPPVSADLPATEHVVAKASEPGASAPKTEEPRRAPVRKEAAEPQRVGRLLVRSTPSGAQVSVDGVAKGVTPLAIRDLDLGSRAITVTRGGYQTEERRIVLTKARPSRSLEVRLAQTAATRPSTPGSFGRQTATTGMLAVESQPAGASVTVNGKPSGTTPLMISDLAPGEYRVTLTLRGFREFATTVRVVAGERARAAARLTEQEQE